jgi:hypothetical protein
MAAEHIAHGGAHAGRTSHGRALEPQRRLIIAARGEQPGGPVILPAAVTSLRRTPVPLGRGLRVAPRAPPFFAAAAHEIHRALVLLFG